MSSSEVADSRVLSCTSCGDPVEVFEAPEPWIDADRFVCMQCRQAPKAQLALIGASMAPRRESPAYDPQQARIPF